MEVGRPKEGREGNPRGKGQAREDLRHHAGARLAKVDSRATKAARTGTCRQREINVVGVVES